MENPEVAAVMESPVYMEESVQSLIHVRLGSSPDAVTHHSLAQVQDMQLPQAKASQWLETQDTQCKFWRMQVSVSRSRRRLGNVGEQTRVSLWVSA